MKRYIQYYQLASPYDWDTGKFLPQRLQPVVGSDGVLPLDGRYSVKTCLEKARQHARKKAVRPNAFALVRGTLADMPRNLADNRVIYVETLCDK